MRGTRVVMKTLLKPWHWVPPRPVPEAILAVDIRESVHVVVRDFPVAVDVSHLCAAVYTEIMVLHVEAGTI